MKFAEIVIKPLSPFGTPLKGDTIFGHFCWQVVYDPDLIEQDFQQLLDSYGREPFVVFSSAFPKLGDMKWLFPRPSLPLHYLGEEEGDCFELLKKRKDRKRQRWILVRDELKVEVPGTLLGEVEAFEMVREGIEEGEVAAISLGSRCLELAFYQSHNTINRLTFTTGENFAPYQTDNICYLPGLRLSIFVLFNENIVGLENLRVSFERIGRLGFGRDASLGLGQFLVEEVLPLYLPKQSRYLYTTSPFVPGEENIKNLWYQPFVRFGRHGGLLAGSGNPFKEPVLMAMEGAVLETEGPAVPLVGRAVCKVSKALEETVIQGYSITLPLEWEN